MRKSSQVKIKTGRSLTNYRQRKKNEFTLGRSISFIANWKGTNIMGNKNRKKTPFFPTPPFFQGSVSLLTLSPTHYPWVVLWDGVLVNSQYFVSAAPVSSCYSSVTAWSTSHGKSFLKEPLPQFTDAARRYAPAQGLYGIQLPSGNIHHCMVTSMACRADICFGVVLSAGCSGTTCPTTVFSMGCRHLEHFFSLLLHWLWCLQGFSSHSSVIELQPSIFFPFSSMLL